MSRTQAGTGAVLMKRRVIDGEGSVCNPGGGEAVCVR